MTEVFDNNRPIYLQIMDLVKKGIIAKEFLSGARLLEALMYHTEGRNQS